MLIGKFVSLNREISWILRPVAKWVLSVRTVGAKTYLAVNLIMKNFKRTKMNRSWFITSPHETMFGVNAGSARLTCWDMLEKLTASQQQGDDLKNNMSRYCSDIFKKHVEQPTLECHFFPILIYYCLSKCAYCLLNEPLLLIARFTSAP